MSPLTLSMIYAVILIQAVQSTDSRKEEFSRIKHYELIEINTNLFESANIIELTAFDQYYKVKLMANPDMTASNIRHTSVDINSIRKQHQYFTSFTESCHYFGRVLNANGSSKVALSLCNKRGIRGRIMAFDQSIIIKPSAYYFDFENSVINGHNINDQVLVYKLSDFDTTNIGKANAINLLPRNANPVKKESISKTNRRRLYTSTTPAITELFIINGPERTQRYQNEYGAGWYGALYAEFADIVNQVSADYAATNWGEYVGGIGAVKVKWVELEVIFAFTGQYYNLAPTWLSTACMTSYSECAVNGLSWLRTLKNWLYQYKDVSTFDNVQLISDIAFSAGTAGWGNIGQICKGSGSVSDIYEGWGLDYIVKTMEHELGHNFGMSHDANVGCDDNYIMGGGYDRFSSCSITSVQEYFYNNAGLTCLSVPSNANSRAVISNYDDNEEDPPTTTTTEAPPTPQPAPNPTPRPTASWPTPMPSTAGDGDGEWSCFGLRNANGISGFNGNWAREGSYAGKNAYYLNGYYLYFHATYGFWLISLSVGATSVKGYCREAQLTECGGNFRALSSTGWVDETACEVYDCRDSGGTAPTPPPANTPSIPSLACTYFSCLRIDAMALDEDGRSYNGDWHPSGCHNGESYYLLSDVTDRYLCYSSYNLWMISQELCGAGKVVAYSPQRDTSLITATQNNWQVLGVDDWSLDSGVMLVPCGGTAFTDDGLDCLLDAGYENLCFYSNNSLWNGERDFAIHPALCSDNKPVYRYIIYNNSDGNEDEFGNQNEYIFGIYFLHFYEELIYSDGDETIGKWIMTKDEISIKALAICEKDNLLECGANSWIVDEAYYEEGDFDGVVNKVIDKYMMLRKNKCGNVTDGEVPQTTTYSVILIMMIIIGGGVLILVIVVVGCCVWCKSERHSIERSVQRVSDGFVDGEKIQIDYSDEGGMQMIEKIVEIDDNEIESPLTTTTYN